MYFKQKCSKLKIFFLVSISVDCIRVEILEDNNENVKLTELCKSLYFNTKRFIDVSKIQLGSRSLGDFEADGFEDCKFTYRNQSFQLKCKILSTEIEKTFPGVIPPINKMKRSDHSEFGLSNH